MPRRRQTPAAGAKPIKNKKNNPRRINKKGVIAFNISFILLILQKQAYYLYLIDFYGLQNVL